MAHPAAQPDEPGPGSGPGPGHEAARGSGSATGPWARARASVYWRVAVVTLIVAAAAGLFAGSYCFALAHPTPHRMPIGLLGGSPRGPAFVSALEHGLKTTLTIHHLPDPAAASLAVDQQQVFAVLRLDGDRATVDVVSAAGASVARILTAAAPPAGAAAGVAVTVRDVKPLQSTDPQGLAVFYLSLAAVVIGFVGATQLAVHAAALRPLQRIGCTLGYAVLGGFAIAATVDWWVGVLRLPFVESWGILVLTMLASGMVFTMFNALIGRWALIPTWGLMVLLGNPSSGGAVSWPLLPQPLGLIGRWLPTGACVGAQHTAIYFYRYQHVFPFLVLAGWVVVCGSVFLLRAGRTPRPAAAE
jgi:hypothetical protein